MELSRLNRVSSLFANRLSRRDSLKYGGVGLGAAALGGSLRSTSAAQAQEATPTSSSADHLGFTNGERSYTMFIQTAKSGTWEPKADEEGVYTLTLTGLPAQTVYFSDRPDRIVGTQSTSEFLNALGFIPDNPPNAALVTTANGEDDVLVIELFNPAYNESGGPEGATLVYEARILENYRETEWKDVVVQQQDTTIPSAFDGVSLFIDDCADGSVICHAPHEDVIVHYGCCYSIISCHQCGSLDGICDSVPGCEDGSCQFDDGKDCFY